MIVIGTCWKIQKEDTLLPIAHKSARIDKIFDSKIRRDHQKNFLWAPRLPMSR